MDARKDFCTHNSTRACQQALFVDPSNEVCYFIHVFCFDKVVGSLLHNVLPRIELSSSGGSYPALVAPVKSLKVALDADALAGGHKVEVGLVPHPGVGRERHEVARLVLQGRAWRQAGPGMVSGRAGYGVGQGRAYYQAGPGVLAGRAGYVIRQGPVFYYQAGPGIAPSTCRRRPTTSRRRCRRRRGLRLGEQGGFDF